MKKSYYSLGLMSGTSGDGVDASVIQSDGEQKYRVIKDKYFKYSQDMHADIHNLKHKINSSKDIKKLSKQIQSLEQKITYFHANVVNEIIGKLKLNIDFVGFHGQTIFHNAKEKKSKQLGDGKLLSRLTKKTVIYDFRKNDLKNGGQGAPLAPIFHKLIVRQKKIKLPVIILNLGGIANWTYVAKESSNKDLYSADAGPGNCLIDQWMIKKSNLNYDKNGSTAKSGKVNKVILNKAINKFFLVKDKKSTNFFMSNKSYDVKDFNLSFAKNLSLEDGAATLTEYTSLIVSKVLNNLPNSQKVIVCGGGRKNKFLSKRISKMLKYEFYQIENLKIDGDFVESQAFAYLAIRSYLKLPISFPNTTGVAKPCTGGIIVKS